MIIDIQSMFISKHIVLQWAPFVIKGENNTYTGLCFDLLDHLAMSMNFTYVSIRFKSNLTADFWRMVFVKIKFQF